LVGEVAAAVLRHDPHRFVRRRLELHEGDRRGHHLGDLRQRRIPSFEKDAREHVALGEDADHEIIVLHDEKRAYVLAAHFVDGRERVGGGRVRVDSRDEPDRLARLELVGRLAGGFAGLVLWKALLLAATCGLVGWVAGRRLNGDDSDEGNFLMLDRSGCCWPPAAKSLQRFTLYRFR